MIEKEIIESIKNTADLMALVQSRGIELKKNGQSYLGLCPFHEDTNPSLSVNPSRNLWQCFCCGKGGDVIRFVELFDKLDFPEAVETLQTNAPAIQTLPKSRKEKPSLPESRVQQLLGRAVTIYEKNFEESGTKHLEHRGIIDAGLFTRHRVGFCNGKLSQILPSNGQVREDLRTVGILGDQDTERFSGCVVFPVFDLEGNIVTLYGRFFHQTTKRHVFLPNRPKGLWNIAAVKTYPEIILTESVIDVLSVETAGYANVISIQGTNGLCEDDIRLFKEHGVYKLILMLDGDKAGQKAVERLKEKANGFAWEVKKFPDGLDPNSYLMKYGASKLAGFIQTSSVDQKEQPSLHVKPLEDIRRRADGFVVNYGLRQYQVIGLEKGPRKLKATIRVEYAGKLHVDTLDFYSARSRKMLAQDICRIFDELAETVEADITRLVLECEKARDERSIQKNTDQKPAVEQISARDEKEALEFGRSTDLIQRIMDDFERCGLIGEEANKLLGYIAMTSRKRTKPLSVLIMASSGAGKTALQDAIVQFCPPEDLVKITSLSGKALFYKDKVSLTHKVLALEEGDGAADAFYAIRSLISSGVLVSETTIKDLATGRLTTMENRVEGPTAVFYTTTNPEEDPETKSRFFVTGIDESREQTRKILAFQRKSSMEDDVLDSIEIESVKRKHWNFQRLLKPLAVKNPFADKLTYQDDRLQGRRDQPKYHALIKSVGYLRQMQKQVKFAYKKGKRIPFIEIDKKDIRIANKLYQDVMGRSLDELSRPGRDLLILLDEMVENKAKEILIKNPETTVKRTGISFIRRDIREYTGWSQARIHRYLKELVDLEYVIIESGRNGFQYRYCLAYEGQGKDGSRFVLGLTPVEELK